MTFTRTLTAIALVMGLGAAPALAQEVGLDADEDSLVTEEEYGAYGEGTFGEYDADQSGFVDEEEYGAFNEAEGFGDEEGELFGQMDADEDEQVGEDEWFGEESFAERDEDESGAVEEDDEWF